MSCFEWGGYKLPHWSESHRFLEVQVWHFKASLTLAATERWTLVFLIDAFWPIQLLLLPDLQMFQWPVEGNKASQYYELYSIPAEYIRERIWGKDWLNY